MTPIQTLGSRDQTLRLAVGVVMVGAVLAAVGSFLPWARLGFAGQFFNAKGFDGWEGKTTAIFGAFMAIRALMVAGRGGSRSSGLATLIVIGGVVITGIAIYTMATFHSQVESIFLNQGANQGSTQLGQPVETVRSVLKQLLDSGQISEQLQFGVYAVLLGGLLGLVGGGLMYATGSKQIPVLESAPTPAGPLAGAAQGPWFSGTPPMPGSVPAASASGAVAAPLPPWEAGPGGAAPPRPSGS